MVCSRSRVVACRWRSALLLLLASFAFASLSSSSLQPAAVEAQLTPLDLASEKMSLGEAAEWRAFLAGIGAVAEAKVAPRVQPPRRPEADEQAFELGPKSAQPGTSSSVRLPVRRPRSPTQDKAAMNPPPAPTGVFNSNSVVRLLELSAASELSVASEMQVTAARAATIPAVTGAGTYANVGTLRRDIRGGGAANSDATKVVSPLTGATDTGDDIYDKDVHGRVTQAVWEVRVVDSGDPGADAEAMCDVMWNPHGGAAPGGVGGTTYSVHGGLESRIGSIYQEGHIIATGLGGSDTDPMNFFPHHYQSNGCGSRWWRMEKIAAAVQSALNHHNLQNAPNNCRATVYIKLGYGGGALPGSWIGAPKKWPWGATLPVPPDVTANSARDHFVPRGGLYTIQLTAACWAAVNAVQHCGTAIGPVVMRNAYFCAFVNQASNTGSGGKTLTSAWKNGPDMALQAAPAGALDPRYTVAAHLWP